eukprot:CAMPEP_0113322970 /NCGR_PEP_ID=MMETSP0010_2-20120614/15970_1 /TAXON_ID=216773 ORGANISM="Corethron hystrix, Strain 308" /NCGR_SAMPLE_ID=MMETSP0010_2 /ASSEMBLY_ACC=CAM_ASM_000155 /LENGTH=77 /DNA_ID=CAMNT_0000181667 /DNA_START=98 /DNA_END=328 /DNA_ORIENTATION=+ /assembly_acc=CAM_ASM_000155
MRRSLVEGFKKEDEHTPKTFNNSNAKLEEFLYECGDGDDDGNDSDCEEDEKTNCPINNITDRTPSRDRRRRRPSARP